MTVITPRQIDIGGFPIRRSLPARELRAVGPWVFFDHMGPYTYPPAAGVDVIPHPHINLATVTYLFDGEIVHRDTLGSVQPIRPGAINLMVAGRGIAHSERTGAELRAEGHTVHGLQLWHALPEEHEEDDPLFLHYPANQLPTLHIGGFRIRILMGSAYGVQSPVQTFAPTFYAELTSDGAAEVEAPHGINERALYVIQTDGTVSVSGTPVPEGRLVSGVSGEIRTSDPTRMVVIGGASLGKRYMWWNFVSSRVERIEQAQADWKAGRFGSVPGDDTERAPLPESDSHARMNE